MLYDFQKDYHFQKDEDRLKTFALLGFGRYNPRNLDGIKYPYKRGHVYSAMILNLELLKQHKLYYDPNIHIWEDIEFNERVNTAGLMICKIQRYMQRKKQMRSGGCNTNIAYKPVPGLDDRIFLNNPGGPAATPGSIFALAELVKAALGLSDCSSMPEICARAVGLLGLPVKLGELPVRQCHAAIFANPGPGSVFDLAEEVKTALGLSGCSSMPEIGSVFDRAEEVKTALGLSGCSSMPEICAGAIGLLGLPDTLGELPVLDQVRRCHAAIYATPDLSDVDKRVWPLLKAEEITEISTLD